jgi:antitoxin component HigA of HigAB toxin-antitoxin module
MSTTSNTAKPVRPIANDEELNRAIDEFYPLSLAVEQSGTEPDAYVLALRDEIDRYEREAGYEPGLPTTVAGLLELEMFKRRLRQRGMAQLLDVPETRLSEILRGKRGMNLDFARRLHQRLGVAAEVVLTLRDAA